MKKFVLLPILAVIALLAIPLSVVLIVLAVVFLFAGDITLCAVSVGLSWAMVNIGRFCYDRANEIMRMGK